MYLVTQSGLGALNCPGDPGCPGNVQPDKPAAPDVQQQIADLWDSFFKTQETPYSQGGDPGMSVSTPKTFTQVLNENAGKIALGAGAFFLVMAVAKR